MFNPFLETMDFGDRRGNGPAPSFDMGPGPGDMPSRETPMPMAPPRFMGGKFVDPNSFSTVKPNLGTPPGTGGFNLDLVSHRLPPPPQFNGPATDEGPKTLGGGGPMPVPDGGPNWRKPGGGSFNPSGASQGDDYGANSMQRAREDYLRNNPNPYGNTGGPMDIIGWQPRPNLLDNPPAGDLPTGGGGGPMPVGPGRSQWGGQRPPSWDMRPPGFGQGRNPRARFADGAQSLLGQGGLNGGQLPQQLQQLMSHPLFGRMLQSLQAQNPQSMAPQRRDAGPGLGAGQPGIDWVRR